MRSYAERLGELQGDIMLGLTYVIVVFPIWIILRVTGRPLLGGERPGWHERSEQRTNLPRMRAPF